MELSSFAFLTDENIHHDFVGIIYLCPGHFNPEFHKTSFTRLLEAKLDIEPPFIIVAENSHGKIKIRLRNKL